MAKRRPEHMPFVAVSVDEGLPDAVVRGLPDADRTPASAPATRRRRKQTRPRELLEAALSVFVEKGYAATRTEEVARCAGVSKGTLYLYFASKDELFKAVVRENLSSLIAQGEDMAENFGGTSSELLSCLVRTWWKRVGSTPAAGIHKIVLAEARNFPVLAQFYLEEVVVPANRLFSACIQRGIARAEFRQLPVQETVHVLLAALFFMAVQQHSIAACALHGMNDVDPSAALEAYLEVALRGVEVRAGSGRARE